MKKKKFLVLLVFVLGFAMFFPSSTVKAARASSSTSTASVYIFLGENSGRRWREGILKIDGRIVYCTDYTVKYWDGDGYYSVNALDFFQNYYRLSKNAAQELLTELALYKQYLDSRGDLTPEQRYFFGQALVWNAIKKRVPHWEARQFWIETWNNPSLFPCKTDGCQSTNDVFEWALNSAAEEYYQNNKRKYIGMGTIWTTGSHQPLIELETKKIDYDYTIDAACVNCNSNNSDNKAYVIQDTNEWDAIFASADSDNNNVNNYYKKGNGVYCREEYQVYLPNATNTVYVEPGRYFTVNPSASALDKVVSAAAIPNLKPIKVVKKRQCKVNPDENKSNASTVLDTFRRNSEYDFKGKTGTIKFKYNETYEDSRYKMSSAEKLNTYDESGNYTYSINNGMLDMQVTKYYTLPDNYYQYIRKQDGLSMKSKPSSHIEYYTNVGIPNLPVSFNNTGVEYGATNKAADIQFSFELPGKNGDADRYSLLYKAYTKDNKYLGTDNESGNIYNRYKKNKMKEGDEALLRNSACAKMYGYKTSAFETCVVNRVNNAIGDGGYNCVANSNIDTSTSSGYACVVLTPPDDDGKCSTEEDAKKLGQDWNPYDQTCCPVGTTYNPTLGKCENTCRIENGKYYDYNGKEISKDEYDRICPNSGDGDTCRIENGKYYDFNGNEITKERYDEICPSNLPPECPVDCEYGCCPSGECAPMPGGVCPGSGGIDVIYRTIDLENPFPGQNAEQRKTGANWCSYNIKTQKIDCKYNNQTVKNYITRERSSTYNGGKVYREDHILYEITLDSKAIGKVRSYNDKNRYDDWDLKCLDNGKACKSEFLQSVVETTGKCASASKSSFYTCDKDV